MTGETPKLRILLDEGTPVMVASPFLAHGHEVIHHSDVLDSGAKDDVVVATAILNKAVLVAVDCDMKRMVRRFGAPDNNEKYTSLDLIFLSCNDTMAEKRLEQAMSFVENEWAYSTRKRRRRLWLDINNHRLSSYR